MREMGRGPAPRLPEFIWQDEGAMPHPAPREGDAHD